MPSDCAEEDAGRADTAPWDSRVSQPYDGISGTLYNSGSGIILRRNKGLVRDTVLIFPTSLSTKSLKPDFALYPDMLKSMGFIRGL